MAIPSRFLLLLLAAGASALGCATTSGPAGNAAIERPNVVIIFTDDQGYGDVGAFYAQAPTFTPNIDRMAAEGTRFTDFYVAQPVCSASRAALLTGCYANRLGIHGALGPNAKHGISAEETLLSEICKSRGYATAIYGKWHLGHRHPFLPLQHGFDEFHGIPYSNDMWPLHPDYINLPEGAAKRKRGYPDLPLLEGNGIAKAVVTPDDQREFTTGFTDRAVDFIDRNADRPFFLYVPHPMPHVPLFVHEDNEGATGAGLYGDVMHEIDLSVGRILDALRRNGIDERTLVIFATDNGPWLSYGDHGGSAGPLREGKGTTFDGGVRVPCVMRWPGTIPAGRVCREPVMTIDLLPTIAGFIGGDLPPLPIDGRDAGDLVLGVPGATSPQEAYFFYYHRNHLEAMRSGRWKLHFPHKYRTMKGREPGAGGTPGRYDYSATTGLALYDLSRDIGETRDVAAEHPEVVARLSALADAMRSDLGDALTEAPATGARAPGRIEPPAADAGE
jgi:arylsulfatase A-like enzyme